MRAAFPVNNTMAEKRRQSTNHSGVLTLHPRMWGRIFEYVDDSLDDLARVKAAGCVLVCCKDLKRILAAGGAELWLPLIESVVAVAPCVGRSYAAPTKPWLPLAALSTNCLHCRDRVVASLDPFYGVRACDVCSRWGDWMISERDAKAEYLVTDEDLRKCPGRRGAGPWRYYVERHVNLASARRFGARRAFDGAKIIRSLRIYGGASAARIAEEYLESSPEYCQELLDALVRGKCLRKETALGKPPHALTAALTEGDRTLTAATVKALREAKKALDEGRMSEEDFKTTKAGLLYPPIYAVAPSCNSGPTGAHTYYDEHTGRWVPHEAHLVCDMRVGQVTRRPSSE